MVGGMSRMVKQKLLAPVQDRYRGSSRKDKSRLLDEFIAVTGHHQKHGIRLLGQLIASGGQLLAAALRLPGPPKQKKRKQEVA